MKYTLFSFLDYGYFVAKDTCAFMQEIYIFERMMFMLDRFLNKCEECINRIKELYETDEEFRGFVQAYALGSMVGITGLTICFYLGHPEWALSRKCVKLIVKNMSAKKK